MMKKLYYLLIPLFLSSCTANNNVNSFSGSGSQTDVISFSKSVIKNQSTALDKLMTSLLSNVEQRDKYTIFNAKFYPGNGIQGVRRSFVDYCKQVNGKFSDGVCENERGINFYFKSWLTGTRASNLDKVAFTVVSPTNNTNNESFVNKIRSLGYVGPLSNSSVKLDTTGKCEVFIFYDLSSIKKGSNDVTLFNNGKKIAELNSKTYVNYFVEENSTNHFVIKQKMLFGVNGDTYGNIDFQCSNQKPLYVGLGVKANYFIRTSVIPFGRGKTITGISSNGTITMFHLDKMTMKTIRKDRNIKMPLL